MVRLRSRSLPVLTCALVLSFTAMARPGAQTASRSRTAAAEPAATPQAPDASAWSKALDGLKFREIGPAAMGGRVDDVAVVESNPAVVYIGLASGGVWKTTNGGTTWTPIFDKEQVSTIGDVTVAPSDPSVVWVGTGEPNNRQSSSWGNGVYKSLDGGQTWKHMGLRETHHIGRLAIHPSDPSVVYVAAVGRLWGPNKERGVYKTSDGGQTWKQVLFVSEDTGVVDLAMDPKSPDTLYAAAYQRRRAVFGFAGSGPEGGIYKTTDGGATWKKLENGLPSKTAVGKDEPPRQEIGRIGLGIYRRDPSVLYALVEHAEGGIFRSDDKGETWRKMSDTNPRPMYYSKVFVDPNNDQRVWVLGANMFYSEDGGKTFNSELVQRIHGDYHALWINPANSDHMITGSDGGIHWSYDRGRTWDFVNNIAIGQFYEIGADMRRPYNVCGGLQDNNTWCGPSATSNPRGIGNGDWFTIGGGDGFYAQIDPTDPDIVYAESQDGNVLRRNLKTGENRSIRPQPAEGEKAYRFQWNSPIVVSAHDPKTIYYAGNFVFRSPDRGDTWTRISPDLTSGADRNTLPIMGRVPDKYTRSRHDGVQNWPAVTTLAESVLSPSVLWAGTDDGNLHVTRDGGRTWKNVIERVPGVPKGTYVSRVIASRHAEGTAYATFDGHRSNDFGIYVYATADHGESWRRITAGLPDDNGIVNVIREDPRNADVLYAGGEYGAFVSFNRGGAWQRLKMNLPTVPVDDILVHPRDNDLILGTHGRSIWILDDLTPLQDLSAQVLAADLHVFPMRPATQWRPWANTGSTGHKAFFGENPPAGLLITYYVKEKPAEGEQAKITVTDPAGKTVRELTGPASAGLNRVAWDTRAESPIPPDPGGQRGAGGGGGFFGMMQGGPRVDPGEFTVKVKVGDKEAARAAVVEEDPRITMSAADRQARRDALDRLMPKLGPAVQAQRTITALRATLVSEMDAWKKPGAKAPESVTGAAAALLKKIDDLYPTFATPPSEQRGLGDAGPPLVDRPAPVQQRMMQLYGQLANYSAAPTPAQVDLVQALSSKSDEAVAAVKALVDTDLAALNKAMNEAGVAHIAVPAAGGRGGGRP